MADTVIHFGGKVEMLDNELAYEYSGGKKLSWCE